MATKGAREALFEGETGKWVMLGLPIMMVGIWLALSKLVKAEDEKSELGHVGGRYR